MALGLGSFGGIAKWIKDFIFNDLYRINQQSQEYKQQTITGDVNSTGFITGIKCGLAGWLTEPADTIVKDSGYVYMNGTFENNPAEGFERTLIGKDDEPAIQYVYTYPQYFQIDCCAVFNTDVDGPTITFAIKKNNDIVYSSIMSLYMKFADQQYSLSGTCVVELSQYDTIQIVVKGDRQFRLTVNNFTATINEFFD